MTAYRPGLDGWRGSVTAGSFRDMDQQTPATRGGLWHHLGSLGCSEMGFMVKPIQKL